MSDSMNIDHPTGSDRVPPTGRKRRSAPPAKQVQSADAPRSSARRSKKKPARVRFTPQQWAFGEAEEGVL